MAVRFESVSPESVEAREAILRYMTELAGRGVWKGEPNVSEDAGDFRPPGGAFLVGVDTSEEVVACGGVRLIDHRVAEIKRMWVAPARRREGIGRELLAALEGVCRESGASMVRLDTNGELREAVAFYERVGFVAIERYNENPDATHFFQREIE